MVSSRDQVPCDIVKGGGVGADLDGVLVVLDLEELGDVVDCVEVELLGGVGDLDGVVLHCDFYAFLFPVLVHVLFELDPPV